MNRLWTAALVALLIAASGLRAQAPEPATKAQAEEILKILGQIQKDGAATKKSVANIEKDVGEMKTRLSVVEADVKILKTRPTTVRVVTTTPVVRTAPYCGCVARGLPYNTCGRWSYDPWYVAGYTGTWRTYWPPYGW